MSRNQEARTRQDLSHVLILTNPKAGRGPRTSTSELIESLQQHGLLPQLVESLDELTVVSVALAKENKLRCVVGIGGDGTILLAYERARAKGHAAEVLEAVRRLGEGGLV